MIKKKKRNGPGVLSDLSKEELEKKYYNLKSCEKVGNIYGVSASAIRQALIKNKIPIQNKSSWPRGGHNIVNMIGQKFGKLTVKERAGSTPKGAARWKCQCKCGNETIILGTSLRAKLTESCGCLRQTTGKEDFCGIYF